jgi:hypothetical protein
MISALSLKPRGCKVSTNHAWARLGKPSRVSGQLGSKLLMARPRSLQNEEGNVSTSTSRLPFCAATFTTFILRAAASGRTSRALKLSSPSLAAIENRFDAERRHFKAEQDRLERELAKAKDRIGKLSVDQSLTDYHLGEMRKQAKAASASSIEMEVETKSTHFQMRATHPDAARALRDFASQIIRNQDGTLLLSKPAGNA